MSKELGVNERLEFIHRKTSPDGAVWEDTYKQTIIPRDSSVKPYTGLTTKRVPMRLKRKSHKR